jgi:hypothetical protein
VPYPQLAEIQEMKRISKSLLPIVIYTICQELSLEEYRKEDWIRPTQNVSNGEALGSRFSKFTPLRPKSSIDN